MSLVSEIGMGCQSCPVGLRVILDVPSHIQESNDPIHLLRGQSRPVHQFPVQVTRAAIEDACDMQNGSPTSALNHVANGSSYCRVDEFDSIQSVGEEAIEKD